MRKPIHFVALLFVNLLLTSATFAETKDQDSLVSAVYRNDVAAVQEHLKNPDTIKKELDPECPPKTLCKPVTFAARNGSVEIMKLLLDAGANVEGQSGFSGDTPLIIATINKDVNMIKLLLEHGASVNQSNNFGVTAFWGACADGRSEIVSLFIEHSANLDQPGQYPDPLKEADKNEKRPLVTKITPLMISAADGRLDVVRLLLAKGADSSLKDSMNRTALDYAKTGKHAEIIKLLEDRL